MNEIKLKILASVGKILKKIFENKNLKFNTTNFNLKISIEVLKPMLYQLIVCVSSASGHCAFQTPT